MNADRDIERLLDTWLADGPMRVSDRVFDEAVGRVHRQRQRPAWRLLWKEPHMSPLKVALGAAAIIVVFVAGFAVLGRPVGLVGGVAAPTASPTPSPTPSTSPAPIPQHAVEAGTYRLQPFVSEPLTVDADVPAGWSGFETWAIVGPADTDAPAGMGIGFIRADGIFSDPCRWDLAGNGNVLQQGDVAVGPTVDDLANALHANSAYTSTAPVPVVIGGHAGKQLVLQVPPELDLDTCDKQSGGPQGLYLMFSGKDAGFYAQGPGNRWTVSIIDAGGTRLVAAVVDYAGTPPADVAAAQAIMDSLVITP